MNDGVCVYVCVWPCRRPRERVDPAKRLVHRVSRLSDRPRKTGSLTGLPLLFLLSLSSLSSAFPGTVFAPTGRVLVFRLDALSLSKVLLFSSLAFPINFFSPCSVLLLFCFMNLKEPALLRISYPFIALRVVGDTGQAVIITDSPSDTHTTTRNRLTTIPHYIVLRTKLIPLCTTNILLVCYHRHTCRLAQLYDLSRACSPQTSA